MQKYSKKKDEQKLGFRTPDHFKGQVFRAGKNNSPQPKFNPSRFRIQHKG